jgi:hypothetical protein
MNKNKLTQQERDEISKAKSTHKGRLKNQAAEMQAASHDLIRQVLLNDTPNWGGMKLNGIDIDTPSRSVYKTFKR